MHDPTPAWAIFLPMAVAIVGLAVIVLGVRSALRSPPLRFKNPSNGYIETARAPGLFALVFGAFYFAAKGVWLHAVIGVAAALLTGGLSWLVYPFFARRIVRTHYLRAGWSEVAS